MKARFMVAAILAVMLSAAASTASARVQTAKADSITVWLMGDAQSGWPNVVAEANAAFKRSIRVSTSRCSTRPGATT